MRLTVKVERNDERVLPPVGPRRMCLNVSQRFESVKLLMMMKMQQRTTRARLWAEWMDRMTSELRMNGRFETLG